ncbi:MAG TPA: tetratricopeptide repeat protein [Nevskiaceae bacterium]|nr:tetratricopeptide repeat protein [Nevskiaceae bacterium]
MTAHHASAVLVLCLPLLGLAGCAVPGGHHPAGPHEHASAAPDGNLSDTALKRNDVHLTLIRDMIANGQYYAALAHIQAQEQVPGGDTQTLKLLEADTRRNLGQYTAARSLYEALLNGPLNGQALHGLGLLYAHEGDLTRAIADLKQSAKELPTDVDVRNDLGYALMQAGDYQAALPQLSTAAQLAPSELRSRRNLIILMYLMDRPSDAARLAARSGLDRTQLLKLRQQARTMQNQKAAAAG